MIFLQTDFVGVLFLILFVLFTTGLLATPAILTFFLYRWIKKKGKPYKIVGLVAFIGAIGFGIYGGVKVITDDSGFSSYEEEVVNIEQKIGGILICSSTYSSDIHSWNYSIDYSYKFPNDTICHLGIGGIYGEKWDQDEQIMKIGEWYVLKASNDRDADALFVGKEHMKEWSKYVISPYYIEQHDLWKKQGIESQLDNWDTVAKVESVGSNGIVTVKYKYRKGNAITNFQNGKRKITFKINMETGFPEMVEIAKM